jgi:ABC-type glycerol-3-phosphate transport system substrate-binding protein
MRMKALPASLSLMLMLALCLAGCGGSEQAAETVTVIEQAESEPATQTVTVIEEGASEDPPEEAPSAELTPGSIVVPDVVVVG